MELLGQIESATEVIKTAGQFGWAVFLLTIVLAITAYVGWHVLNRLLSNSDRHAEAAEKTAGSISTFAAEVKRSTDAAQTRQGEVMQALGQAKDRAAERYENLHASDRALARAAYHYLQGCKLIHKDDQAAIECFERSQRFLEQDFEG